MSSLPGVFSSPGSAMIFFTIFVTTSIMGFLHPCCFPLSYTNSMTSLPLLEIMSDITTATLKKKLLSGMSFAWVMLWIGWKQGRLLQASTLSRHAASSRMLASLWFFPRMKPTIQMPIFATSKFSIRSTSLSYILLPSSASLQSPFPVQRLHNLRRIYKY